MIIWIDTEIKGFKTNHAGFAFLFGTLFYFGSLIIVEAVRFISKGLYTV